MINNLQNELAIADRETPLLLVVDDDFSVRSMIEKTLRSQGYDVLEASSGAEAVELFQQHRPDMVLLDVIMPVMNGFETCAAMSKLDPENSVPIIMLTGLDDVESVDKAFESGATDFIAKPINWSLFSQRIRYFLRARKMYFALRKSQLRVQHTLKVAMLGYWDWDLKNDDFKIPANVLKMLGIDVTELKGVDSFIQFVPEDDKERVRNALYDAKDKGTAFEMEHQIKASDNTCRYVYQHCEVVMSDNGIPLYALGTIQDITALKRAEDMILHQAYHDILTDLPNQTLYKERLVHAIKIAEHADHKITIIMIDIDRFQMINESLGQDSANELLLAFAGFLVGFVNQGNTVSRINGSEFAILLERPQSTDEVIDLIQNIRTSLNENIFRLAREQVYLSLSMGLSVYPDDGLSADILMQHASAAMRKAKAQGGDQACFYTVDMNRRIHDRLRLETDLRQALDENKLELYYQPQVEVKTRKIIAAEALVRWKHPVHGLIPPHQFVPLAEESGLIKTLGLFVLKEAISQARKWHDKGYALGIGINLSARQFMQDDLVEQVATILDECKLEAKYIDLEITESIAMQDAEGSIKKMHQLKKLGINLSMDDFGTGYSSLSYLHQFPLDALKIDRSFIKDIKGKQGDGAIALAVIAMAKSMGLKIIAEGVENEAQYDFLNKHDCDVIQGFLISKPIKASEFEKLLEQF